MSTQIAVRLPDELVAYVDEAVAAGRVKSRAELVTRLIARDARRQRAEDDLQRLIEAGARRHRDQGREVQARAHGQLGFYMTAVDAQVKHDDDAPTIGLLLCKTKNEIVAEYALRDSARPLGISEYQLAESLPEPLQTSLPTIEQIERELAGADWRRVRFGGGSMSLPELV